LKFEFNVKQGGGAVVGKMVHIALSVLLSSLDIATVDNFTTEE